MFINVHINDHCNEQPLAGQSTRNQLLQSTPLKLHTRRPWRYSDYLVPGGRGTYVSFIIYSFLSYALPTRCPCAPAFGYVIGQPCPCHTRADTDRRVPLPQVLRLSEFWWPSTNSDGNQPASPWGVSMRQPPVLSIIQPGLLRSIMKHHQTIINYHEQLTTIWRYMKQYEASSSIIGHHGPFSWWWFLLGIHGRTARGKHMRTGKCRADRESQVDQATYPLSFGRTSCRVHYYDMPFMVNEFSMLVFVTVNDGRLWRLMGASFCRKHRVDADELTKWRATCKLVNITHLTRVNFQL